MIETRFKRRFISVDGVAKALVSLGVVALCTMLFSSLSSSSAMAFPLQKRDLGVIPPPSPEPKYHDLRNTGPDPIEHATMHPSTHHLVVAKEAAVVCDVPLCSQMASDLIQYQDANAVDAGILVSLCIGSVNFFASGIGGGGYMTIRTPNDTAMSIVAREMAPGAANASMFMTESSQNGGLAIAIPGEIAGLYEAHKNFGRLPWKKIFEPVIELNRKGFYVSNEVALASRQKKDFILDHPEEWGFMLEENGTRVKVEGEYITRPKYADTLEIIANNGTAAVFYDPNGPIAPKLAAAAQRRGGILTAEDFTKYHVRKSAPVSTEFMGRKLYTPPNPSGGPALVLGLNILGDGFAGTQIYGEVETQRLIETMKFIAAARTRLGDHKDNQSQLLLSKEWALEMRANITDDVTHGTEYYKPYYQPNEPKGTTHFSVLDKDGMGMSMTTTINLYFGSKVCDIETGVVLNCQMDDFANSHGNFYGLLPSTFNQVEPYKRPLSSTVPSILVNQKTGKIEMMIGCAGGSRITTSVLQGIVRKLAYNLPLLESISYPRVHHQLIPENVFLERHIPGFVVENLATKGHAIEMANPRTAMNGIYRDPETGIIHAVGDWWRKQSGAAGF
ncbi:glutathione hydrolase proenzyme [Trichomonascus vanleenenianus]|uniref:gamma-glutamyltransferase family protein n=1 Tax=Trichomonascus vanleenenianus TaxID=2268995 RepID=UPI003EC9CD15